MSQTFKVVNDPTGRTYTVGGICLVACPPDGDWSNETPRYYFAGEILEPLEGQEWRQCFVRVLVPALRDWWCFLPQAVLLPDNNFADPPWVDRP